MDKIKSFLAMWGIILGIGLINNSIGGSGITPKGVVLFLFAFAMITMCFNHLYKESRKSAPLDEMDQDDIDNFLK